MKTKTKTKKQKSPLNRIYCYIFSSYLQVKTQMKTKTKMENIIKTKMKTKNEIDHKILNYGFFVQKYSCKFIC